MLSAKMFRGLEVLFSSVESCFPNWFVWSSCFETGSIFLSKTDEGQNKRAEISKKAWSQLTSSRTLEQFVV